MGNFILKECFADYLKGKTRVLVTHKFESLKYVDYIYMFRDGKIVESGTLEMLQNSEVFQEIERKYNMQEEDKVQTEDKEIAGKVKGGSQLLTRNEGIDDNPSGRQEHIQTSIEAPVNSAPVVPEQPKEDEKQKAEVEAAPEEQEEAKKLQQKLMLAEDRKVGEVGWALYKSYFNYYGSCLFFTFTFIRKCSYLFSLQLISSRNHLCFTPSGF